MKRIKIDTIEDVIYEEKINNAKSRTKFIKRVERIVRGSMEYKDFIQYISKYMDMNRCAFFLNAGTSDGSGGNKLKIERHHTPLTLYDICDIVLQKFIDKGEPIDDLMIAQEVLQLHYEGKVGLIPLSKAIHKIVHNTDLIKIPLWLVSDGYIDFLEEYEEQWTKMDGIEDKLKRAMEDSASITEESFKNLVVDFEHIDIKDMNLPKHLDTKADTRVEETDSTEEDENIPVQEILFSKNVA